LPLRTTRPGAAAARRLTAIAVALLAGTLLAPGAGAAPQPGPGQSIDQCFYNHLGYENYGPTDINAQAGDTGRRVTVNENSAGTLTVFKWPNPSYYNQVKYLAVDRDGWGRITVQAPNHGVFAGVRYTTSEGPGFAWLRDWRHRQLYNSQDTAVPVTIYRSAALGLTVTAVDLVVGDTFQRQFIIRRDKSSPVRAAELLMYENFNPVASRKVALPLVDSCMTWLSDQHAAYEPGDHAVVNWWKGMDDANGKRTSVALAMGFNGADSSRQVGADGFDPGADPDGPADPWDQLAAPPHRLGGATTADGQTVAAMTTRLRFNREGRAAARFTVAAAKTGSTALIRLRKARRTDFPHNLRQNAKQWRHWLGRTILPESADPRIRNVSKRSLISLRLAMVPKTGAIVASSSTQGPYGEDWIRDGAFFNEMLDWNGFHGAVTAHNRFYARVQAGPDNPSDQRPDGNWPEGSYGDGIDGLPIAWEIDETGFGLWTLFRHANFLKGAGRASYLADVYPAIVRAADFLTSCRDPANGLQCVANEDDNFDKKQTIYGALTTVLGLRSAIRAAGMTGDTDPRVDAWRARLAELRNAIHAVLYNPVNQTYLDRDGSTAVANFKNQGWLLWPAQIRPRNDPAMAEMAIRVEKGVRESLAGAKGSYELKGIVGLSRFWNRPTLRQSRALKRHLIFLANEQTTPVGVFGEAWQRTIEGWPIPVQSMPHVWMHTLFYMAASKVWGTGPYDFQRGDYYSRKLAVKRRGHGRS